MLIGSTHVAAETVLGYALNSMEKRILEIAHKSFHRNETSNNKCQKMEKKHFPKRALDEDGIRTHACRAHWISSPTP